MSSLAPTRAAVATMIVAEVGIEAEQADLIEVSLLQFITQFSHSQTQYFNEIPQIIPV